MKYRNPMTIEEVKVHARAIAKNAIMSNKLTSRLPKDNDNELMSLTCIADIAISEGFHCGSCTQETHNSILQDLSNAYPRYSPS